MIDLLIQQSINIKLNNIALSRFVEDSEYPCVISPFTRIYLITEGEGWLLLGDKRILIEPGYLYLTPSFTPCSYFFEQNLEHFYVHFSARLLNGLNIYSLFNTQTKVLCSKLDRPLFERLLELNPNMELPTLDPDIYQTKEWLSKPDPARPMSHSVETRAILELFLSRFIQSERFANHNELIRYNMNPILNYIQDNLKEAIHIDDLAQMACLSTDHFSRIFKKVVGFPPGEFIISKRIEKAKLLLITTNMPLKGVIEESGFSSLAYFSRIFKKFTNTTPLKYRRMRG